MSNDKKKENISPDEKSRTDDKMASDEIRPHGEFSDEIDKILQEVRKSTATNNTASTLGKDADTAPVTNHTNEVTASPEQELEAEDEFVDISAGAMGISDVKPAQAESISQTADAKEAEPVENIQPAVKKEETTNAEPLAQPIQRKTTVYSSDKPKSKDKNSNSKYIVLGLVGAVVLLVGAFYGTMKLNPAVIPVSMSINVPDGTVPPVSQEPVFVKGVYVAGIDVGGKTLKEAQALLAINGQELVPDVSINVQYDGKDYKYSKGDFEYTYDIPNTLKKAYDFNTAVLSKNSTDAVANAPTDDKDVVVDTDSGTVNFMLDCKVIEASVQKVVKRVAKEIDIPCVEPHVSKFDPAQSDKDKRFTFEDGTDGLAIDQDKLRLAMLEVFNNNQSTAELSVETSASKPTLTMDEVKNNIVKIGEFSTISTNGYNANSNMVTALKAINGTIVEPDGIFSFNQCTGDSNDPDNGYVSAGVISGGQMTTGYGGGICQGATTIYNAGLMANMEIVERAPHLWCSYYVYGGLDATIDYGGEPFDEYHGIDLKMRNTSKYQMFFVTWMDGVKLNCEIYGWQSSDFDEIRTESELTWVAGEEYGYAAQRVYYKNGEEVKREDIPSSTYSTSEGHSIRPEDPGDVSTKITDQESGYPEYASE